MLDRIRQKRIDRIYRIEWNIIEQNRIDRQIDRYRDLDRQIDRQIDRYRDLDRQIDRDIQIDRSIDRQIEIGRVR